MSFELFNKLKEDIINIDENLYEDLEEDYNEIVDIDNTSIHNLNFFKILILMKIYMRILKKITMK